MTIRVRLFAALRDEAGLEDVICRSARIKAGIVEQDVERAFGKEKLVGGVVDFLTAEVPEVDEDTFVFYLDILGVDIDAVCLGFA